LLFGGFGLVREYGGIEQVKINPYIANILLKLLKRKALYGEVTKIKR
jgi:hypothetical protein